MVCAGSMMTTRSTLFELVDEMINGRARPARSRATATKNQNHGNRSRCAKSCVGSKRLRPRREFCRAIGGRCLAGIQFGGFHKFQ